MFAHINC